MGRLRLGLFWSKIEDMTRPPHDQFAKQYLVGLRQKTNREKPQPQSLLGIYFEKPKIAETQIDQGKSKMPKSH